MAGAELYDWMCSNAPGSLAVASAAIQEAPGTMGAATSTSPLHVGAGITIVCRF